MKRWLMLLLCALLLCVPAAQASLEWPVLTTQGQQSVQTYVQRVNGNLAALGMPAINSLFEAYPTMMNFGITGQDNGDLPEGVELNFVLSGNVMTSLTVRTTNVELFAPLVASCIQAAEPTRLLEDTMVIPAEKAALVKQAAGNSFEDVMGETDWLQGDRLRVYYAYRPDEYHDGNHWLQAVLIFPRTGEETPMPTFAPVGTPTPELQEGEEPTPTPRLMEFAPRPAS